MNFTDLNYRHTDKALDPVIQTGELGQTHTHTQTDGQILPYSCPYYNYAVQGSTTTTSILALSVLNPKCPVQRVFALNTLFPCVWFQ